MDLDPSDDGLHLDKHEDLDGLTMSEKKALGKALNRVSRAFRRPSRVLTRGLTLTSIYRCLREY
jgi:hypothetical protein